MTKPAGSDPTPDVLPHASDRGDAAAPPTAAATRPSGEGAAYIGAPGLRLCLTVFDGPDAGQKVEIQKGRVLIGRGPADLRLSDPAVSAQHCTLEHAGGGIVLRDLRTPGGTWVNGARVSARTLQDRDEIRVGSTGIVFTSVAALEPPPEATSNRRAAAPGSDPGAGPSAHQGAAAAAPDFGAATRAVPALRAEPPLAAAGPGAEPAGTVLDGSPYQPRLGTVRRDTAIFLEVLTGPQAGQVFDLARARTYLVGRKGGDIPLDDVKCSQKHARIDILAQGEYYVSDLASTNGTFLNDIRTTRRRLRHMDVLRIGSTLLRFSCMEGAIPVAATE